MKEENKDGGEGEEGEKNNMKDSYQNWAGQADLNIKIITKKDMDTFTSDGIPQINK